MSDPSATESTLVDIDGLEALAKAATPGPWCATKGCGAQVGVGECIQDTPGSVAIKRGGFFLLEIEPNSYARRDSDEDDDWDEEKLEERAHADAALIAAMRNSFDALLREVRASREREAQHKAYAAKLCPHGCRYHAECPECCE